MLVSEKSKMTTTANTVMTNEEPPVTNKFIVGETYIGNSHYECDAYSSSKQIEYMCHARYTDEKGRTIVEMGTADRKYCGKYIVFRGILFGKLSDTEECVDIESYGNPATYYYDNSIRFKASSQVNFNKRELRKLDVMNGEIRGALNTKLRDIPYYNKECHIASFQSKTTYHKFTVGEVYPCVMVDDRRAGIPDKDLCKANTYWSRNLSTKTYMAECLRFTEKDVAEFLIIDGEKSRIVTCKVGFRKWYSVKIAEALPISMSEVDMESNELGMNMASRVYPEMFAISSAQNNRDL